MTFRACILAACVVATPCIGGAQTTRKPLPPGGAGQTPTKPVPIAKTPSKPPKPVVRTTLSGVYTLEEARAGKDIYASLCASCHTAASHTGPPFRLKWTGRPLAELYTYMRTMMPKNDPASLADEDYAVLLAYMLQMNRMPAGKRPLSTDSLELAKIRIDTARSRR